MSVTETTTIDFMSVPKDDSTCLRLHIMDQLDWEDPQVHLQILTDKINAYLGFLERKEWKKQLKFKFRRFKYANIHIVYLYDIPKVCEEFMQRVQDAVGTLGVLISAEIADEEMRNRILSLSEE